MSLQNYNSIEAANLSLGQGGFGSFTNVSPHAASDNGCKRWTGILIVAAGGGVDIVLESNTGDDLTIGQALVTDLLGSVISGDFHTVNAGGHHIMAFKG